MSPLPDHRANVSCGSPPGNTVLEKPTKCLLEPRLGSLISQGSAEKQKQQEIY